MKNQDDNTIKSVMSSFKEFFAEMQDDNDRAVVIVGAANIDSLLEVLLIKSLLQPCKKPNNRKDDDLFGVSRPLSSFSTKINLSYRLGLIDKELCSSLHIIRDIRNDFAHKIKGCILNTPPHSDKVEELRKRFNDETMDTLQSYYLGKTNSSKYFRIVISLISSLLEMKLRSMPKTMKANPVSTSWVPSIIEKKKG